MVFSSPEELFESLKDMQNREDYCVYFNNDQSIKKVKCEWYLAAHRVRGKCTLKHIFELWLTAGQPAYNDFLKQLELMFDFECYPQVLKYAEQIDQAAYLDTIDTSRIQCKIAIWKQNNTSRKDIAKEIHSSPRANSVDTAKIFALLDNKSVSKSQTERQIGRYLPNDEHQDTDDNGTAEALQAD
jgi:hypothetical protein